MLNAGRQEDALHRSSKRGKLRRSRGREVRFSFPRLSQHHLLQRSHSLHSTLLNGKDFSSCENGLSFAIPEEQDLQFPHLSSLPNIFRRQSIDRVDECCSEGVRSFHVWSRFGDFCCYIDSEKSARLSKSLVSANANRRFRYRELTQLPQRRVHHFHASVQRIRPPICHLVRYRQPIFP